MLFQNPSPRLIPSSMRCKSNTRVPTVENDKLRFEHDVSENLQGVAVVGLDGSMANVGVRRRRRKLDERTGYGGHVAVAEANVKVGELGIAGDVVVFGDIVKDGALNSCVISCHRGIVEKQERSSRVGDCRVSLRVFLGLAVSDLEGVGGKLPEPLRLVHEGELDGAGELRGVDFAKFVGAYSVVFKVGGKNWLVESGHHVVEKGRLWLSLTVHGDGVDVGESKAKEPVGIGILDKAIGDVGSQFNGLSWDRCTSNINSIDTHLAICMGFVAILDGKSGTWYALEGARLGRIVDVGSLSRAEHGGR